MLSAMEIVGLHDRLNAAWHGGDDGSEGAGDWLGLVARQHRANFDLWHVEDEARTPGCSDAELALVKRRVDSTNQRRNDLAEQLDRVLLDWLAGASGQGVAACEDLHENPAGAKAPINFSAVSARLKSCPDTKQAEGDAVQIEGKAELHIEGKAELRDEDGAMRGEDGLAHDALFAGPLPNPDAPLHSESPGLIIDRLSILALKIYHTREEAEREDAPPGHAERNRDRLAILEEQRADLANCLDALWRETLEGTRRFKLYRQLKMYNDPSLNPAVYRKLGRDPGR